MARQGRPKTSQKPSLPPAARRWLESCVPADAPSPERAWVGQRGSMDADGQWLSFTATGTYEARPLLYDWRARLRLRLGVWMLAKDGYSGDEGWTGAWLYGIKSLGQRNGPDVLVMQVIRNLAELAWVPDLARSEPSLEWVDSGPHAFVIRRRAGKNKVAVRFDVDANGDIVRTSTQSRPLASPEGAVEAPWRCDFAEPREFDGVRIPSTVVASYERDDGPWEYFRAEVTSVDRQIKRE